MKNKIFIFFLLLLTQFTLGCASKSSKIELVKTRAVFDLNCPSIEIVELGNNVFGVTGCGKRTSYIIYCKAPVLTTCTAIINEVDNKK